MLTFWVTVVLLPASSNKQLAYCLCPRFFFFPLLLNITENLLTVRASRPKIVAPGLVRLATHWQNLSSFPVPSAAGFIMNCSRSSCDLAATPTGVLSRTDKKKKEKAFLFQQTFSLFLWPKPCHTPTSTPNPTWLVDQSGFTPKVMWEKGKHLMASQCFPHRMHKESLRTLLTCRLWFISSGVGLIFCFSDKLQGISFRYYETVQWGFQ